MFSFFVRRSWFINFKTSLLFLLLWTSTSLLTAGSALADKKTDLKNTKILTTNVSNLFDKIYVISLDRTPERYEYVKNQLDKVNLKHERFPAVDGKLITVKDIERNKIVPWKKINSSNGYLRNACLKISHLPSYKNAEFFYITDTCLLNHYELGCAMSHRAVWADVVKHGYKRVIIFEDDVLLEHNFIKNLAAIVKHLPNDFDVFFLNIAIRIGESENTSFFPPNFWLGKFVNTPSPYYAKIKPHKHITCANAYMITCGAAMKLLKGTNYMHIPIDTSIIFSGLNLYVSKLRLLTSGFCRSTIWGQSEEIPKNP